MLTGCFFELGHRGCGRMIGFIYRTVGKRRRIRASLLRRGKSTFLNPLIRAMISLRPDLQLEPSTEVWPKSFRRASEILPGGVTRQKSGSLNFPGG
jgi:hypothetical protein